MAMAGGMKSAYILLFALQSPIFDSSFSESWHRIFAHLYLPVYIRIFTPGLYRIDMGIPWRWDYELEHVSSGTLFGLSMVYKMAQPLLRLRSVCVWTMCMARGVGSKTPMEEFGD